MQITVHTNDGRSRIALAGRFDFSGHREFRNQYQELLETSGLTHIDLDFQRVDYIDSSGLGMLLLLRERAMARQIEIAITNSSGTVRQLLDVANFGRLFKLH